MERKKFFATSIALLAGFLLLATNVNAETWTLVNSTGNHFTVTYGSNLWVIVGDYGLVKTSPDGVTWTNRNSRVNWNLRGVVYGFDKYVAVGYYGCIIYSYNGIDWTRAFPDTTERFRSVCYSDSDSLFVAVGDNGIIFTSPNGINWSERDSGVTTRLYGVCFSDELSRYLAVGYDGEVLGSDNGEYWMRWTLYNSHMVYLFNVVYGADDNLFVAVSRMGYVYTGPYGLSWTKRSTAATDEHLYAVTYGNSRFMAAGNLGAIISSPNGTAWTLEGDGLTGEPLWGIAHNGGTGVDSRFVAVGQDVILYSTPE